jgi:hypothetical protein
VVRYRGLTAYQQEPPRVTAAHLVASQELRVMLEKFLKNRLRFIRRCRNGDKICSLADEDDVILHEAPPQAAGQHADYRRSRCPARR